MGKLTGKVAFITGAARGQGRSHALRLAEEGADIIAVDICRDIESVSYPLGTSQDLQDTVAQIESLDRRVVHAEVDVRDAAGLRAVLGQGVADLGGVDIVLPNAGILGSNPDPGADQDQLFRDVIDINLTGVWNTINAAAPIMIEQGRGGAIVLTSSTQGITGRGGDGSGWLSGYCAAKHGVVGLMRSFANWLAPYNIRVNSVHPTGVNTPMIMNETVGAMIAERPELAAALSNLMPVEVIEAIDISNAIAWLVSDEARYVTGVTLPVDAGFAVK
ncbi:MAG TPA: mycofactocin-coupled SDR family oxidoreductase [Sporichthya sp.]|nr:mycofactocin-coupled SDR family oxidoreductase [Sporichthya sp.]